MFSCHRCISCCSSSLGLSNNKESVVTKKAASRRIDAQLASEGRRLRREVKLLLLGAAESGKSTFIKQMRLLHPSEGEFDPSRPHGQTSLLLTHDPSARQTIYSNMIKGMRVLVDAQRKLGIALADPSKQQLGDQLLMLKEVNHLEAEQFVEFKSSLKELWEDAGIKEAFRRRSEFQVIDSLSYFYTHLDRIGSLSYVPNEQDVLYSRKSTKGIKELCVTVQGVPFRFVDVGGQRTQRQKWLQCFDAVTAILFLASASEFDQVLVEDARVNRVEESRRIFDTIVNNSALFSKTSFVLFVNKMDLLEEKVNDSTVDIRSTFPTFGSQETCRDVNACLLRFASCGPMGLNKRFEGIHSDLEDVKLFVLYLFLSKVKHSNERRGERSQQIYFHFTTAVDTSNIYKVFSAVRDTILRRNLDELLLQ